MRRQHTQRQRTGDVGHHLVDVGRDARRHVANRVVGHRQQNQLCRIEVIQFVVVHEGNLVTGLFQGAREGNTGSPGAHDGYVHICSDPFQPLVGCRSVLAQRFECTQCPHSSDARSQLLFAHQVGRQFVQGRQHE
jgi:hypothetical protein